MSGTCPTCGHDACVCPTSGQPAPEAVEEAHTINDPETMFYLGNCLDVLPGINQKFDLIFADPPFNYGVSYDTWTDNLPFKEYADFTDSWLIEVTKKLSSNGSLWINVPDEIVSVVDMTCMMIGLVRINWCIWHYRFGQCTNGRFIKSKVHVLYYAKNEKNRIWHPEAILVPSDRATKYNDPRTQQTANPGLRVPLDVWCSDNDGDFWGRVPGNSQERRPLHPNQLPERYLERVIRACTNEDSWVLDPFVGSGTTTTVARALGRRSVGIDVSAEYLKSAKERTEKGAVRV